jgi:RNA polymerase sigma-70 factor (ECF subfamily)
VTTEEFEAVYARTMRPLRAYLLRAAGDPALADDVLQETYYRFLSMEAGRRDATPERPLIFRLATHVLCDHFRRFRREERHSRAWPRPRAAVQPDLPHDLDRVFRELTVMERSLLWLAHVEGLSHAEVAAALDVKPGSVRVLLFRARRALAGRLRDRGLEPR